MSIEWDPQGITLESARRPTEPRFLLLVFAACAAPAAVSALQPFVLTYIDGRHVEWQDAILSGSEWLILGALTPAIYHFVKRFPLRQRGWRAALATHVLGVAGLCATWTFLSLTLATLLQRHAAQGPHALVYVAWTLNSLPWALFAYTAVAGSVYAFGYFAKAKEKDALAARLAAQLTEARLNALRMQLNPHFLFNCLNTVLVLVREKDTLAASRVMELLGDVLRQALRSDRRHEVPLDEELRFLDRYLAIEQVRFADRLRVTWSIDERARACPVPGFILQPLVENAIKHGINKRAGAGCIEISAAVQPEHLWLTVRDDGLGIGPAAPEGVGLANTKERLGMLYGDGAGIEIRRPPAGGTEVLLRIPLRTQPP